MHTKNNSISKKKCHLFRVDVSEHMIDSQAKCIQLKTIANRIIQNRQNDDSHNTFTTQHPGHPGHPGWQGQKMENIILGFHYMVKLM